MDEILNRPDLDNIDTDCQSQNEMMEFALRLEEYRKLADTLNKGL